MAVEAVEEVEAVVAVAAVADGLERLPLYAIRVAEVAAWAPCFAVGVAATARGAVAMEAVAGGCCMAAKAADA